MAAHEMVLCDVGRLSSDQLLPPLSTHRQETPPETRPDENPFLESANNTLQQDLTGVRYLLEWHQNMN